MLIFGLSSREYVLALISYVCEVCGHQGAHRLVKLVRKFSLFFIPLFPVGTRYLDTCTVCARTIEVSRDQAELAVNQGQALN